MAGKAGRSGKRLDKVFRDSLMLSIMEAEGDKKKLRKITDALVKKAAEGDVQSIKECADRLDGKPAQALEHQGADGGPIIFKTVYEDKPD